MAWRGDIPPVVPSIGRPQHRFPCYGPSCCRVDHVKRCDSCRPNQRRCWSSSAALMGQVHHQGQRPHQQCGEDGCCQRPKAPLPRLAFGIRCTAPCLPRSQRQLMPDTHLVLLRPITAVEKALLHPCQRLSHLSTHGVHATEIPDETLVLLIHLFRSQLMRVCHNAIPLSSRAARRPSVRKQASVSTVCVPCLRFC